jgi:arylsulfatase A-like enzyme
MAARDLAHVIALYDGEIRFTDDYVDIILDQLRSRGVLDDTLVVVTADHGDEFFEHGRKGHKQALYDESILVPLMMRYPARIPAGRVVDEQVRLMDVAPTILGLAGVPPPAAFGDQAAAGDLAGRDLRAWINAAPGAAPPPLAAYSDLVGDAPVPIAALRTPQYKLIQEESGPRREELYALGADPGERTNLLASDPAAAPPLRRALSDWRQAWAGDDLSEHVVLSPEHQERLRALGYRE